MTQDTLSGPPVGSEQTLEDKVRAARDETQEERDSTNRTFVSYSRRDSEFTLRLVEALARQNIDAWVDWEDIPKSATWRDEISRGIESANSFVFLLSPASLASGPCQQELAHAVACGKLIVPVVSQDVLPADTPPEIEQRNWIFLRPEDNFDRGVADLVKCLTTDLEWVRMHTQLLEGAIEWETHHHDKSCVLRGSKLRAAEQWQSGAGAGKEPPPTPLHYQFILASAKAQSRRQKVVIGAVTIGLVIAAVLATIAVLQRNEAVRQQAIATSRQLDAEAVQVLPVNPELSVLLADEAWKRAQTTFASETLRLVIPQSHIRKVFYGHTRTVNDVVVDPTGRYALTASDDGTARIWDIRSGSAIRIIYSAGGPVRAVAWDPLGRYVATAVGDVVRIWNARTGAAVYAVSGHRAIVRAVHFSPDGRYLVTASDDWTSKVWEVGGWRNLSTLTNHWFVNDAVLSPDDQDILTASGCPSSSHCGVAKIWNWRSHRLIKTLSGHLGEVYSATYGPTGLHVVTASADGTARVWEVASGQTTVVLGRHVREVFTAEFSPTGPYVVTAGIDGTARVWDFRTGENFAVLPHSAPVYDATFTPNGKQVITASAGHTARLWDADTDPSLRVLSRSAPHNVVNAVTISPNGRTVITGGANGFPNGALRLWDRSTGRLLQSVNLSSWVNSVAFSRDGMQVFSAQDNGELLRWDVVQRGRRLARRRVLLRDSDGSSLKSVSLSANGREALTASGTGTVWILTRNSSRARVCASSSWAGAAAHVETLAAALSPDGKFFSLVNTGDAVRIWSVATCKPIARLGQHALTINSVAFSPDGRYLVTSSLDGLARVWDVARRQLVASLASYSLGVNSASFSPNGEYLITGNEDYTARVWRAGSWTLLEELRGHIGSLSAASFGPDSQTIATASDDGTARIYRCNVCGSTEQLLPLVRIHVSRGLTSEERRTYLP